MADRGRRCATGLIFFPFMVDFFDDDRIFDLLEKHGPLGICVYLCTLCIVYKNGYYAEIPLEKLSRMIIKMIGSKWIKNKEVVAQVILFCADIGLLHDGLLKRGVITSAGIQKRFYKVAVKLMRRRLYDVKYWLLKEENSEALLSAPKNGISSEENRIVSEENTFNSEEKPYKRKENKSIYIPAEPEQQYFDNTELNDAFKLYVLCRNNNGDVLGTEQIKILRDELISLSEKDSERIAIVKKATVSNWKSFYPLKKSSDKKTGTRKKNGFCNFKERDNDTQSLERQIIEKRMKVEKKI